MLILLPYYMIRSLLLTEVIELTAAFLIGVRNKIDYINIIFVNIMTNPVVVVSAFLINYYYGLDVRNIALIFLEFSAFFSEGLIYKKHLEFKKINPFSLSIILNAFSFFSGEIINKIL